MADYFPILARALDTMSDRGPAARRIVYDRAKTALTKQLRSLNPPLGEPEFNREVIALDEAIDRAEAAYGSEFGAAAAPPTAVLPDLPSASGLPADGDERIGPPPAIKRGGARRRPLALAAAFLVIMVPIAVVAWLGRDRPAATSPGAPTSLSAPSATRSESGDNKFADRIGGAPASRDERPSTARVAPPVSPASPARPASTPPADSAPAASQQAAPVQPAVAVAQRATLIEEEPGDPQQPHVTGGRALWRLDAVNGGQGDPLETVVRATVEFPDLGLSMMVLVRRNTDAAFPASHTMELTFASTGGDTPRVVRDVAMPQLKPDETTRGVPLAGLSVPVKENVSLIGLSNLNSDVERNSDLLLHRSWIDLPIRYASGRKAILSFEKGVSGERVLADAFRQWTTQP